MKLKSILSKNIKDKKRLAEQKARKELEKHSLLWNTLQEYLKSTGSTGCSHLDYLALYNYVRQHKPVEILECGTGVSTIVIATALKENASEGQPGRITSLEDQEKYFHMAQQLLPEHLTSYIDLLLRPRREYCLSLFRGVGYDDVPALPYDFVYIDGPNVEAPSDGTKTFDFDFLNVVANSSKPVSAVLDGRFPTAYVLQKIFGNDKVRYDPIPKLFWIGPCVKEDINDIKNFSIFNDSFYAGEDNHIHFDIEHGRMRAHTRKQAKGS